MPVYPEMPKWFENFYALKLTQMLWMASNAHLFMKLPKAAISRSSKCYPVMAQNLMYTMFSVIIPFTTVQHPMLVLPFGSWVNEVE